MNAPMHINMVLDIFRKCMSEKLRNRVFVSRGQSTIDVELPEELGGNGPSYAQLAQYWKEQTQGRADWFAEQDKYKMILEST